MKNNYRKPGNIVVILVSIVALVIILIGAILSPLLIFHQNRGGELNKAVAAGHSGLCGNIPPVYRTIFLDASRRFNVQPAFLAAIFVGEHRSVKDSNYQDWPNPDGPWAESPRGASGPFQFMPLTWSAYGYDGNRDGTEDIQNLVDAAFSAARYLSASLGAGGSTTDLTILRNAAARYNGGSNRYWTLEDGTPGEGQRVEETRRFVSELVMPSFERFYCEVSATAITPGRVPQFFQDHGEWANERIGGFVFSNWGCCPTAAAMVIAFSGVGTNPGDVGRLTVRSREGNPLGFLVPGRGTDHSVHWLNRLGEHFNLPKRWEITGLRDGGAQGDEKWQRVINHLKSGKPLIARGDHNLGENTLHPPFTDGGHCVVFVSYNEREGKIFVQDTLNVEARRPQYFTVEFLRKYTTEVHYIGR